VTGRERGRAVPTIQTVLDVPNRSYIFDGSILTYPSRIHGRRIGRISGRETEDSRHGIQGDELSGSSIAEQAKRF
jgi:hypothetical protein